MSTSQEKTELPTPRRRRKAREEGQVPRSKDLAIGAGTLAAAAFLPETARGLVELVRRALATPLPTDLDLDGALLLVTGAGRDVLRVGGPLFAAVTGAVAAALLVQGTPVLATAKITPKLSRLDPFQGLARLDPRQALPKSLLDMARMSALLGLGTQLLVANGGQALGALTRSGAGDAGGAILALLDGLALRIGGAFCVLAVAEFLLERRKIENDLKMTRQEIKEEQKQEDGDPRLKARVRSVQREMTRQRLKDVAQATVVITNPTHVACALRYDRMRDAAPRLIAKGRDRMAQEIKRLARQNDVPTHEDKPLAWALLRVPVGAEVPEHLYRGVAEVLALIERARRRRREAMRSAA